MMFRLPPPWNTTSPLWREPSVSTKVARSAATAAVIMATASVALSASFRIMFVPSLQSSDTGQYWSKMRTGLIAEVWSRLAENCRALDRALALQRQNAADHVVSYPRKRIRSTCPEESDEEGARRRCRTACRERARAVRHSRSQKRHQEDPGRAAAARS